MTEQKICHDCNQYDFDCTCPTELVKKQSRDAHKWAKSFIFTIEKNKIEIDEGFMIGWFANSMMAMHDSIYNKEIKELKQENEILISELERARNEKIN